jgi:branched-chain amino acid transport system ATP-binding protein
MALLEIEDVVAGYGAGPDILRGLSLRIEQDRSYCIIGPNGAGKSTLLRVICGLLPPRRGRVSFKGEQLAGLRTDEILHRGICFVPQDKSLFPDMTVKENVRMGGYILKDRREVERRLEAVFAMFPILRERSARPAKVLSGGEQQMLLLGRALVLRPQVIMLDEPSLGLAPRVARQIFDAMAGLRSSGMTVILVEQNARMGLEFADWGCVLDLGQAVFEGPSGSVLEDPRIQELYLGRRRDFRPASAAG